MATKDLSCGLVCCTPTWLQWFKTPCCFVVVLFLIFFLKGAQFTYYLTMVDIIPSQYGLSFEQFEWVISYQYLGVIPIIIFFPFINFIPKKPICMMLSAWLMSIGILLPTIPNFFPSKENLSPHPENFYFMIAGFFIFGVGSYLINALGIPYIDDNVSHEKSPAYIRQAVIINHVVKLGKCSQVFTINTMTS